MVELARATAYAVYTTDNVKYKYVNCQLLKCNNENCKIDPQRSERCCILLKVTSDSPETRDDVIFVRHLSPEQFCGVDVSRRVCPRPLKKKSRVMMTILDNGQAFHIRFRDNPEYVRKVQEIRKLISESCSYNRFVVNLVRATDMLKRAALHFTEDRGTISVLHKMKRVKIHKTFLIHDLEKCLVNVTSRRSKHMTSRTTDHVTSRKIDHVTSSKCNLMTSQKSDLVPSRRNDHVTSHRSDHVDLLLYVKTTTGATSENTCEIIHLQYHRDTIISVAEFVRNTFTNVQTITSWQLQLQDDADFTLDVTLKFEKDEVTVMYRNNNPSLVIQRTGLYNCELGLANENGVTQNRVTLYYDVIHEAFESKSKPIPTRTEKSIVLLASESIAESLVKFVKSYMLQENRQHSTDKIDEFLEFFLRGLCAYEKDTLNIAASDRRAICYEMYIENSWQLLGQEIGLSYRELIIIESFIRTHVDITAAGLVLLYWQYLHNRSSDKIPHQCNVTSLQTILRTIEREDLLSLFFVSTQQL